MAKSILEEAVADVHSLRKAAEENAKNLLVEAMSPKIEKFIKNHLGQEAADPTVGGDGAAPQEPGQGGQNDVEKKPMSSPEPDFESDDEDDQDQDGEDEDGMYEIDDDEDEDQGDDEDEDQDQDQFESDDDQDQGEEVQEGDNPDNAEDENDEDDDDMKDESVEVTSEDLKRAFAEVLNAGLKEDSSQGKFGDAQDPNDGEYGLAHKVPGETQWANAPRVLKKAKNAKQITKEAKASAKTVQKLQRQLAQYQEAFKYLKKNLNEMNLFNAKLIYTTKLLQNNLSNKQKVNVVESIDKARSKQEVELLYSTLSESLKIAGCVNEQRYKVKGPKASRFTKPGSTLNESKTNPTTDRWAVLAGLTK